MGFCSGTQIFDDFAKDVIDSKLSPENQRMIIMSLMNALENHDWDCHDDSRFSDHPLFKSVVMELHRHDWFEEYCSKEELEEKTTLVESKYAEWKDSYK